MTTLSPHRRPRKEQTMTTTAHHFLTFQVPEHDGAALEDDLNTLFREVDARGGWLEVLDRRVTHSGNGRPFRHWGTGSLSAATKSESTSGTHNLWFKPGQHLDVTVVETK